MDIWQACKADVSHRALSGKLIRVVESQEQVATNHIVDSLAEQQLLERLLESNKPALPKEHADLHYLLATPFRYPPLKFGSRFGKKSEPSLLYASKDIATALAETAYYRFIFWAGVKTQAPTKKFLTQHTAWGAQYYSRKGIALHQAPFDHYRQVLTSLDDYRATQALGQDLRAIGTEVIEFESARTAGLGINIALFNAKAFTSAGPTFQQQWLCETSQESVIFYSQDQSSIYSFPRSQFASKHQIPTPALLQ